MSECGQCACCYDKHEQCAVEKTEAKEFAYFSGLSKGAQRERERILNLIKSYWCYEVGCNIHIADWPTFIMEIKGTSDEH